MKIGLIDVDSHNFPNLALMKISAYHKAHGDEVEWWWGWGQYDRVYMSKVFDDTYSPDHPEPVNTKEIIKGGTGYGLDNKLPDYIEHMYPDYSLYPELTKDTAYGFLSRGCPRGCPFCIVKDKEGRKSYKVADLSEWWSGQKNIVLCDPNLLACREHMDLLKQLADSKAWVDVNQGFDARLLTKENIEVIKGIACRATGYENFNKIPTERLRNVYNTFLNKQRDHRAAQAVADEYIAQILATAQTTTVQNNTMLN